MDAFLRGGVAAAKPKPVEPAGKVERHVPWVEKYRPRAVDDVAYQDEAVTVLRKCLTGGDLPNLLFYGPPGTGKTSTILALARQLFGNDIYRDRVLELNASDDRGIQVVRDKVKQFAQRTASATRPDGKPCPPYKICILDEADSMTHAAQAALRRTMEKESKSTRFCLICNYVSRIIEPLTSRCTKFRFKPLTVGILQTRLKDISIKESVDIGDEGLDALVSVSGGDLRKAITYLQSIHRLKGMEHITEQDISEVASVVPVSVMEGLWRACRSDSYDNIQATVKTMLADAYPASQILMQVHEGLIESNELNDRQKSAVAEQLALTDKRLADGADEYLQLMDLSCVIMNQICRQSTGAA
eukprot:scpid15438/ scgid21179/ Replication factor C subunit 4; Activator 1 subunit 4